MPKVVFWQKDFERLEASAKICLEKDQNLELVLFPEPLPEKELIKKSDFLFFWEEERWQLRCPSEDWAPLVLDFSSKKWLQRLADSKRWRDPLVKACGVTPKSKGLKLLDLTAGLGADSWFLHSLHLIVTAIERSSVLYLLLKDALRREEIGKETYLLKLGEGNEALQNSSESFDIIYLDPMFSLEKKKALPPREMQYLRRLLPPDTSGAELLESALRSGAPRVVMKSALKAPVDPRRHHVVKGKSHRFDVFIKSS
jgi:16S rRNA (guanine1516-N2)-methyltransferase